MDDRVRRGLVVLNLREVAKIIGLSSDHSITAAHYDFPMQRIVLQIDGPDMPKYWPGDIMQVVDLPKQE